MYLPHLFALLLWHFQFFLGVSMSTAIRVRNLGAVLGALFLPLHHGQVWLLPQRLFLPFPIVRSPSISFGGLASPTLYLLCSLGRIYPAPSPDDGP